MKVEDLLEVSADEIAAMTDQELEAHFAPFFKVTRPEQAVKPTAASNKPTPITQTKAFVSKVDQLKSIGIDVSYLLKGRKK